ncbi:arabinosyltransferase domain-containing protein [Nocardia rhamnosiphila]|uniref:arabinosyltransferase domain-containing protein n=1 Tax=Nocardia rhamnosiphila TaxID=426716 RepID=UPI003F4D139D
MPQGGKRAGVAAGRQFRVWAAVAAVVAVLAAVSIPFLPVEQEQARVSWPQGSALSSVAVPLVSYAADEVSAEIPCAAVDAVAGDGGVVVSTVPRQSPEAERYGLVVKAVADTADRPGRVDVVSRGTLLWSAPLNQVRGQACTLSLRVDRAGAAVSIGGGLVDKSERHEGDLRPQVVGVFTDLTGAPIPGMQAEVLVDSRFSSSPSLLKLTVMGVCLAATLAALVLLYRLDGPRRARAGRVLPARWWRLDPVDVVVVAGMGVWHFIGNNTSDDGYQLGMARASDSSGYMANYFRWFGVPEAPFGTPYYDLLAAMAKVSAVSPWVRLPALLAGLLTWWVISREVIPRLGVAVKSNRVAVWTGAAVFLAFWMPFNNGLRPEPIVALGILLTWCSMERAIATRRVFPAAVALILAALTLTVGPSGVICFAVLIAGARRLVVIITDRARTTGYLPLLAPLAAAGLVVLTAVFADQTVAAVREMTHVHSLIGPGEPWFFEYLRYQWLLQINADGWLTRRFAVFVMVAGLVVCVVAMLRRGGHLPGTAAGPSQRLVGVTVGAMILMMFTPTKWTHHFGVYAGLAGAIAALTAVAAGPAVMRSPRNRALFAAAVFFLLSMSFVGANGYWYASSWGVPWGDIPPEIAGKGLSTVAAGAAVVCLVLAAWFHIRPHTTPPQPRSLTVRAARIPVLLLVAAAMVAFQLLSMTKAAFAQHGSYSIAASNLAALDNGCGLADKVLVETDPNASMLTPVTGDIATALAATTATGFTANGVSGDLTSDEVESTTGLANSVDDPNDSTDTDRTAVPAGSETGTPRGTGVNGSDVPLPFGLDPALTPVLGSYQAGEQAPAELVSGWYQLPEATGADSGQIIAITAAGRIRSTDEDGIVTGGQDLVVEAGRSQADGTITTLAAIEPIDIGPVPSWRNLRVPLDQLPGDADVIRIVATDKDLAPDQWLAVTPPRVPQTRTLNAVLGTQTPVLLDWEVGLHFPCQQLMPTRGGVATPPEYRILPDRSGATITNLWQGRDGGGPLGWTQLLLSAETLPTYLDNDWHRDWGSLERYTYLDPTTNPAHVTFDRMQRSGTWTPAPGLWI